MENYDADHNQDLNTSQGGFNLNEMLQNTHSRQGSLQGDDLINFSLLHDSKSKPANTTLNHLKDKET